MADPANDCLPDRRCVEFERGVFYVALRGFGLNFKGTMLSEHFNPDWRPERVDTGRIALAKDLLLHSGAKGEIRFYGKPDTPVLKPMNEWLSDMNASVKKDDCARPKDAAALYVQLSPDFIARASYEQDLYPRLYASSEETQAPESYFDLALDYDDLTQKFWGETVRLALRDGSTITIDIATKEYARSDPLDPPIHVSATGRRGRPPKHKWPLVMAEAVRQCRVEPPRNQNDLVKRLGEWCFKQWGREPAASDLHEYVAPIYKAIQETIDADLSDKSTTDTTGYPDKSAG